MLQTHLAAPQGGAVAFTVHSRAVDGSDWRLHASGRLLPVTAEQAIAVKRDPFERPVLLGLEPTSDAVMPAWAHEQALYRLLMRRPSVFG